LNKSCPLRCSLDIPEARALTSRESRMSYLLKFHAGRPAEAVRPSRPVVSSPGSRLQERYLEAVRELNEDEPPKLRVEACSCCR
jgi:hypothetical protein